MTFGIASIPSTGTGFSRKLFGLDYRHIDAGVSWLDFVNSRQIICPMRHPLEVIKTWRAVRTPSAEDVFGCFDALLRFKVSFWLPIDAPGVRDKYLDKISEAMGRRFETDWQKMGSSGQVGFLAEGDEQRAAPYIDLYDRVLNEV